MFRWLSFEFSSSSLLALGAVFVVEAPGVAQLVPDASLGNESSVVQQTVVRELPAELIEGGALRDSSLFHSFLDFNVDAGQRVYFANPDGVENIFNRVTGNDPSNIFGTLGVDGAASLFLLNPNGIVFGPEAKLDVEGSFFASTAERLEFEGGQQFSAMEPGAAPVLRVTVPLGLQTGPAGRLTESGMEQFAVAQAGFVRQGSEIESGGQLWVGGDLGLLAESLDLSGQVVAEGNLVLRGTEGVRIRDEASEAFVAASRGAMLVQGDEGVDIFALNHPQSGLVSGGDMVLRSAERVGGDAHYWSGGSFRVEDTDKAPGNLFSPYDPVIRVAGDFSISSYTGASLHILAGGKVEIPVGIIVTGADQADGLVEVITLSDGKAELIDGKATPTVDIRAGVDPQFLGNPVLTGMGIFNPPVSITDSPTGADINIGLISFFDASNTPIEGNVLLTNQYQPNLGLTGDIQASVILSGLLDGGGNITIDSRNNVVVMGGLVAGPIPGITELVASGVAAPDNTLSGNGGQITVLAQENIAIQPDISTPIAFVNSSGLEGGAITLKSGQEINIKDTLVANANLGPASGIRGGNVNIVAGSLSLTKSLMSTRTQGGIDAGDIILDITEDISMNGQFIFTNANGVEQNFGGGIDSIVLSGATANSGNIHLKSESLTLDKNASLISSSSGQGSAGNISVFLEEDATLSNNSQIQSNIESGGIGDAGDIRIIAQDIELLNGSQIQSLLREANPLFDLPAAQGNPGSVSIEAAGNISVTGSFIESSNRRFPSGVFTRSSADTRGGDTQKLNAGNILIIASDLVLKDDALIDSSTFGENRGGDIKLDVNNLRMTQGGQITAGSGRQNISGQNFGPGGDVDITVQESIFIDAEGGIDNRSGIFSETSSQQDAGNVRVTTGDLTILNGGAIAAGASGSGSLGGDGGNLTINASDFIELIGRETRNDGSSGRASVLTTSANGRGDAGDLKISTNRLSLQDGGFIASLVDSNTDGEGGNIEISANSINTQGGRIEATTFGVGSAGSISLNATEISMKGDSSVSTATFGIGNSGRINVNAQSILSEESSTISSRLGAGSVGNGGDVEIVVQSLTLESGSQINSFVSRQQRDLEGNTIPGGQGNAGNLNVTATESITLSGVDSDGFSAGFTTATERGAVGQAGNIVLDTELLKVEDGAVIAASTYNSSQGGDIVIDSNSLELLNGGQIVTSARGRGNTGFIRINATDEILISGSDNNFDERIELVQQFIQTPDGARQFQNVDDVILNENAPSGLLTTSRANSSGNSDFIELSTGKLTLTNGALISAQSEGTGEAGDVVINVRGSLSATDGSILTSAQSTGGNVIISARSTLLQGDSDIQTTVVDGAGGDIQVTGQSVLAFDDSDILTFADDGRGGDITFRSPAFFGENYILGAPAPFDNNDRVDINASGAINGIITLPDVTFIQASLTDLPEAPLNPDTLVANSCVSRSATDPQGRFLITGTGGLPSTPGDPIPSIYQFSQVQPIPTPSPTFAPSQSTLQEPQGVYRLKDGRLILSRECQSS